MLTEDKTESGNKVYTYRPRSKDWEWVLHTRICVYVRYGKHMVKPWRMEWSNWSKEIGLTNVLHTEVKHRITVVSK